ncbi:MAG: hypothetical protein M3Q65_24240 [Chloroflexota bacterium]|nr:hypothetical protein [Chloroflexota bacterium]
MNELRELEVHDLSLEELDAQELIELPERELMTGCTSGGSLLSINASVCLSVNASVGLNLGGGGCK